MGYDQLVIEVRKLLRASLAARYLGDLHAHKVRPQAYADGYMKALCDTGLFTSEELLELVTETRAELEREPPAQPAAVRRAS